MKSEIVNFKFHNYKIPKKPYPDDKSKQGFGRLLVSQWRQAKGGLCVLGRVMGMGYGKVKTASSQYPGASECYRLLNRD